MCRPAQADETRARAFRLPLGVTRTPKNTPSDMSILRKTMRVSRVLIWVVLSLAACAARAACNDAEGCPEPGALIAASAELSKGVPLQVAELPGSVVSAMGQRTEAGSASARVATAVSDGRPALVMRSEPARSGARPGKAERGRAEQGSEPSSVWLMLFAGLAFVGFVIAKRIRG
jgi:hypothetical protein